MLLLHEQRSAGRAECVGADNPRPKTPQTRNLLPRYSEPSHRIVGTLSRIPGTRTRPQGRDIGCSRTHRTCVDTGIARMISEHTTQTSSRRATYRGRDHVRVSARVRAVRRNSKPKRQGADRHGDGDRNMGRVCARRGQAQQRMQVR